MNDPEKDLLKFMVEVILQQPEVSQVSKTELLTKAEEAGIKFN